VATVGTPANFVNDAENEGQASFTSFDLNGTVQVSVTYSQPVLAAKVLPSSSGIKPAVSGNQVTFSISQPGQLTVEVNGDWNNSLHLFANSMDTNIPSPNDPNVIYFKAGVYHLEAFSVPAGDTLYLEPGTFLYANADVRGPFITLGGNNTTLRGRGVIDGSLMPHGAGSLIYVYHKNNVQVEGVTLRDSGMWTFNMSQSQNVQVTNMKVFGWRLNSDGIDIDGSSNVSLTNSFFRTYDDDVVVKTSNTKGVTASNINVSQCVVWNQIAHAFSVGAEVNATVANVTFTNCDIIHDKGRMTLLAVYNDGPGMVQNANWSNIRVEEVQRLISATIVDLEGTSAAVRGQAANISFTDITSPMPERAGPNIDVEGYDATHQVIGTLFNGVTVGGEPVLPGDITQNAYVSNVVVAQ